MSGSTACTCEANLGKLRTDWNMEHNPNLSTIEKRLKRIGQEHFNHAPGSFGQFQTQYAALADRLKTEQASSPDFSAASEVKKSKSTGARIGVAPSSRPAPSPKVPVIKNPSATPGLKPQHTRQGTHIVPGPSSSGSDFRTPIKTPAHSAPKPSSDSSKKPEGHH